MKGLDDLLSDFNPLTERPRVLGDYTLCAAVLDRLEDKRGEWREHWAAVGKGRGERRRMLKALKKNLTKKEISMLRDIIATSHAVKTTNKVGATLAAERKQERREILG